jgi:hypothetical protein
MARQRPLWSSWVGALERTNEIHAQKRFGSDQRKKESAREQGSWEGKALER